MSIHVKTFLFFSYQYQSLVCELHQMRVVRSCHMWVGGQRVTLHQKAGPKCNHNQQQGMEEHLWQADFRQGASSG